MMDQEEKMSLGKLENRDEKSPSARGEEIPSTPKAKGGEGEFKELQEFSGELIKLGQEIGEKFKEKEQVEQEIDEKEGESRKLQVETFQLKDRLMRINLELSKLEKRRKQLEGN